MYRFSLEIVVLQSANGIMWSLWRGIWVIRLYEGNGFEVDVFFINEIDR